MSVLESPLLSLFDFCSQENCLLALLLSAYCRLYFFSFNYGAICLFQTLWTNFNQFFSSNLMAQAMLFENFIFMYLLRVMMYKIWNFLSKIEEQNFIDSENECNTKTDPNTLRLFHYGKCLRVPLGHSLIIHLKKVFMRNKKKSN